MAQQDKNDVPGEDPKASDPSRDRDHDDDWDDDEDWDDEDWGEEDDFDEEDDLESWQAMYDTPMDAVVDACYGAKLFDRIADFAPPHAALEVIEGEVAKVGLSLGDEKGKAFFLEVANVVYADTSILEHNPMIACFYCTNEVEPIVDERLLQRFIDWRQRKIPLHEFYRCPDCGGPINVKRTLRDPERHLPWFHYMHGDDFDVADDDKPKA